MRRRSPTSPASPSDRSRPGEAPPVSTVLEQASPADLRRRSADSNTDARDALGLFRQGNHAGALTKVQSALAKDPRNADAWVLMGHLALSCKDGAAVAAESYGKAQDARPSDPAIGVLRAEALRRAARPAEASAILARVLEASPGHARALLTVSRLHEDAGATDKAEALLRALLARHPDERDAARQLGSLLRRRGQVDEALSWQWRSFGAPAPARRAGARRAVFIVQHGPLWLNYASVYAAFASDPSWQATVVAMPHLHPYCTTPKERDGIFAYLEEAGVPYVRWDQFPLSPGCADVVFVPTPWEVVRPQGWRTEELMALGLRLAYVPYCFETCHDETDHAGQFNQPLHQLAWAVFARSEQHKAMFGRYCSAGTAHVEITGHPKMDALKTLETARDPQLDAFVAGRRAVCWNPHFNMVPDGSEFGGGYSTFLRWCTFMLEEFARRPGMALLIRPHPLLFATLVQRRIWTQAQVDAFIARCEAAGNVHIDRRPSYLPVFAASDAMMSDLATFMLEYPMTGKPLLYLRNPGSSDAEEGILVGDFCNEAHTEEAIVRFLDDVADGRDPRAAERRAAYASVICSPEQGAGAAIKESICRRLAQLERP